MAGEGVDLSLDDVADDSKSSDHVSIERAVAGGHLALVAGGEDERVELVGERHHEIAANTRLDVFLRDAGLKAGEDGRESLVVLLEQAGDGDDVEADTEIFGQMPAVVDGALRGVGTGHADAKNIFLAESFDGNRGDDGRIDASAERDDGAGESALVNVVASSEDEGAKDRFVLVIDLRMHVAGERFGVDQDQVLFKRRGLGDDLSVAAKSDARTVKDEAVIASDLINHE